MICETCKNEKDAEDLRPYGPNASMICFKCAMSTSKLRKTAEEHFKSQLKASGKITIIDDYHGPRPV